VAARWLRTERRILNKGELWRPWSAPVVPGDTRERRKARLVPWRSWHDPDGCKLNAPVHKWRLLENWRSGDSAPEPVLIDASHYGFKLCDSARRLRARKNGASGPSEKRQFSPILALFMSIFAGFFRLHRRSGRESAQIWR
jgi:hypothetical protein